MNALRCLAFILIIALSASFSIAGIVEQPGDLPPEQLKKIGVLFPGHNGPFELKFKTDIRLADLGVLLYNYTVFSGGKEAGSVTRITALVKDGLAGGVDFLARYDDKGRVSGLVDLNPWRSGKEEVALGPLLAFLNGKDPRNYREALGILVNGLSAAASSTDVGSPQAAPRTYPLEVRQQVLMPGAKLLPLKAKDLGGREFDTAKVQDRRLVMVFASADCLRCDDMIRALDGRLSGAGKKEKPAVVYIISSDAGSTAAYAEKLGIKDPVVAEPRDFISRLFLVPYKPFVLMFDRGTLKYGLPWEGEAKLAGYLGELMGGRK